MACWTDPGRKPWGEKHNDIRHVINHTKVFAYLVALLLVKKKLKKHCGLPFSAPFGHREHWPEKVGHLLIMELHRPTINPESNLGAAQQKHKVSISRPGHRSKMPLPHSFIHGVQCIRWTFPPYVHRGQHRTGGHYAERGDAAMSPSEVECCWCKRSSL